MRACIGAAGTGKTAHLRRMTADVARAGYRPVVLDANGEWNELAGLPVVPIDAARLPAELRGAPGRVLVVSAPKRMARDKADALFEQVCDAVIDCPGAVLVVPEAGTWMPVSRPLGPAAYAVCTRWRHARIGLFLDFQRFAQVSTEARDAMRWLYCFPASNPRDAAVYMQMGGRALVDAVAECANRFQRKERGWHVRFEPNAPLPAKFDLVRLPPV